ncbi:MAG TPA: YdhR family protein [Polyangiaceae bacterium]|nr:YdhR family protein [Polyangiaceae bacterium]
MNHVCLQVTFALKVSSEEWLSHCERIAPRTATVPGLIWKLWLLSADGHTAGGLYLFRDLASARSYAEGPVLAGLDGSGLVEQLEVRFQSVLDAPSRRTRGLPELSLSGAGAPGVTI